jgi:hypothetical protein
MSEPRGRIRVTVAHLRSVGEAVVFDHYDREPEDLAACVCNCLDWAYQQRKAGNWWWFSVNVAYNEEV